MKAIGDSTDPAALAKQIAFALSGAAANARALRPALLELPASRLKELAEHACRLGELKSDAYLRGVHVERLAKEVVAALGAGTGPGQPAELAGPAYVAPKATQQLSPPPTPVVPVITVAPFPPVQPPPALGPAAGSAQPEASARAPSVDTIAGTIADDDPLPDVPADDTKKARPVVLKLDTGATEAVQQDEGSAKKRRRTSKKPAETAVKIEEPKKEPLPIPIGDRLVSSTPSSHASPSLTRLTADEGRHREPLEIRRTSRPGDPPTLSSAHVPAAAPARDHVAPYVARPPLHPRAGPRRAGASRRVHGKEAEEEGEGVRALGSGGRGGRGVGGADGGGGGVEGGEAAGGKGGRVPGALVQLVGSLRAKVPDPDGAAWGQDRQGTRRELGRWDLLHRSAMATSHAPALGLARRPPRPRIRDRRSARAPRRRGHGGARVDRQGSQADGAGERCGGGGGGGDAGGVRGRAEEQLGGVRAGGDQDGGMRKTLWR
ncbi:hypothetical protein DFJ74DRAFT_657303 [Hyaloraphidium curvatum]|nr:hypothetical protein DFJ74DRAFT_657303 [Hyaloraphidium curvatum]